MAVSKQTVMAIKSYQNQAENLVKNHLLSDPIIPYTSIIAGILACKVIYNLTQLFSALYFKSYTGLNKVQRIEWSNRGISTVHALFIAAMSLYFVFWSDLYADFQTNGFVTFRSSTLSTFTLGVSVGYFIADLSMIMWLYPSLGGIEYVIHHSLSGIAVAYAMFSGEGQLYTFMVLISEVTTPEINMRWFLDTAGLKRSHAYLINGIVIFFAWLVARILLFVYMFYHVYLHYEQVMQMHIFGFFLVFVVPSVLAAMNLMWFGKILRGLKKTLAKRQ
ncbi:hypothetical protein SOVF_022070 [Spinacia oleracea]|uniref:TLC domain-containing protein n=1 Tax=Spinacia oleracea TaxID=3562 RepID=A0A9R0J621_SPIOL|nr:uncharacterized protein LOC110800564 [Spinacia oleracea]KNA23774.1 hypothetical protein SOVF_022070 [Spinacia oleracea]